MAELLEVLFENVGAVIAIIVVLTLAIIAIFKVNVSFDLNDFFKSNKVRHAKKAQHYCAHMEFQKRKNGPVCISWFESPSGTMDWICRTCQYTVSHLDEEQQEINRNYWLKHSKKYKKNIRKYNYHAKRSV